MLPKELTAEHQARAIEVGLYATNMPAFVGGPGCSALQQVLVQEQWGRATNGLGWVMATPPQWWTEVATDYQRKRWLLPAVRGEKHEAYAITEEFAGSDVFRAVDHGSSRRRRIRRQRDQVARHVVQLADYVFVEGVLDSGDHVLLVVNLPWPGVEVVRKPQYSHHIADEHPIVAFNDVRVPAANLVGTEGGPMSSRRTGSGSSG
jgi:acyl-CoA dehydrogenase